MYHTYVSVCSDMIHFTGYPQIVLGNPFNAIYNCQNALPMQIRLTLSNPHLKSHWPPVKDSTNFYSKMLTVHIY